MSSVFSKKHKKRNLQKFCNNTMCVAFTIVNICFYHFVFRQQRKAQLGDRQGVKQRKRDPWRVSDVQADGGGGKREQEQMGGGKRPEAEQMWGWEGANFG